MAMTKNDRSSTYRTDEQLLSILRETPTWLIYGRGGFPLGQAASLHQALEKFTVLAQSGATILAITRLPNDDIIIFEEQVGRLRKVVAGLEVPAVIETQWSEAAN
jgi:hypothetical protein